MSEQRTYDLPAVPDPPLLQVLRGHPTPDELAALVVVLTSCAGLAKPAPRRPSRWADPALRLRAPLHRPTR